jgi:hypothetical protein
MDNWKTVGQIGTGFGIIFVVFAAIAAFLEYEVLGYLYAMAPLPFVQYNMLSTMLPYLMLAVLSFIVAAASRRRMKEPVEELEPSQTRLPVEPQPEDAKPNS